MSFNEAQLWYSKNNTGILKDLPKPDNQAYAQADHILQISEADFTKQHHLDQICNSIHK